MNSWGRRNLNKGILGASMGAFRAFGATIIREK